MSGLTIAKASYAFGNDRQVAANISLSIAPKKSLFRRRSSQDIDLLSQDQQLSLKSGPGSE